MGPLNTLLKAAAAADTATATAVTVCIHHITNLLSQTTPTFSVYPNKTLGHLGAPGGTQVCAREVLRYV